jgi:hypothetical protein
VRREKPNCHSFGPLVSLNMVAITSGKLLITGGSGYIGAWIVKRAVDRGYSVVAAYVCVRVLSVSPGSMIDLFP